MQVAGWMLLYTDVELIKVIADIFTNAPGTFLQDSSSYIETYLENSHRYLGGFMVCCVKLLMDSSAAKWSPVNVICTVYHNTTYNVSGDFVHPKKKMEGSFPLQMTGVMVMHFGLLEVFSV